MRHLTEVAAKKSSHKIQQEMAFTADQVHTVLDMLDSSGGGGGESELEEDPGVLASS